MHAIVLAGGYATSLWLIMRNRPKMLLPIGENTVIGTTLDALDAGRIDDVYVSTNEKFADEFDAYLDEAAYEKPELSVEDTEAEAEKFGVVGALAMLTARLARRSHSEAIPPVSPRYCSSTART